MPEHRTPWGAAIVCAVAASFGWASYYLFILEVGPRATPSAALFYPFLFGGFCYATWATVRGDGRRFAAVFAAPSGWLRTGLILGMQLSVLAATYLTGPVDASLLSLLGDVVLTPLLVAVWLGPPGSGWFTPLFSVGLVLSVLGGTLAIVGGQTIRAIPPIGWSVVVAVPLAVAFYFLLSARAGSRLGWDAVVAQSLVGATFGALLVAPAVPGGWPGLYQLGWVPLVLLAANGVVSFFVAPILYFRSLEWAGLVVPPILMTGIPVFTLLFAVAFLGIVPTWVALLGVPVAVVGGALTLYSQQRPNAAGTTRDREGSPG